MADIAWFGPDGNELTPEQWANPEDRTLALRRATHCEKGGGVQVILLCLNAGNDDVTFRLPEPGQRWRMLFDSTQPEAEESAVTTTEEGRPVQRVAAHGAVLLAVELSRDEDDAS